MAESVKTPLRMTAREFVTCLAVMAWAPQLIAPAWLLARKPPSASWEVAAAFPVPALTAEQVIGDALNIHAGQRGTRRCRQHDQGGRRRRVPGRRRRGGRWR